MLCVQINHPFHALLKDFSNEDFAYNMVSFTISREAAVVEEAVAPVEAAPAEAAPAEE